MEPKLRCLQPQFQFLLGTLITTEIAEGAGFEDGFIPLRYADNLAGIPRGNYLRGFQFLLGTLITSKAESIVSFLRRVSIPLRYADNVRGSIFYPALYAFQFLLGTLITAILKLRLKLSFEVSIPLRYADNVNANLRLFVHRQCFNSS